MPGAGAARQTTLILMQLQLTPGNRGPGLHPSSCLQQGQPSDFRDTHAAPADTEQQSPWVASFLLPAARAAVKSP